ncbi:MAG: TnpV protein [Eubacteriales bacterium]
MKGAKIMQLQYKAQKEHMIPDVMVKGQLEKPLGKYGKLRKKYLQDNHSGTFQTMLLMGTLFPHCQEVEKEVKEQMEIQIQKMKKNTPQNQWGQSIMEIENQLIKEMILMR